MTVVSLAKLGSLGKIDGRGNKWHKKKCQKLHTLDTWTKFITERARL